MNCNRSSTTELSRQLTLHSSEIGEKSLSLYEEYSVTGLFGALVTTHAGWYPRRGTQECVRYTVRRLGALRGLTFAALDCLDPLDFEYFLGFQALALGLARCTAGCCLASMPVEKPKLNASASASARNLIPPMLLRNPGKPQIHL